MTLPHLLDLAEHGWMAAPEEFASYFNPLVDVLAECKAAEDAHGDLPVSAHQRLGILTEEVGEAAQAMNDHTWKKPCPDIVRAELVQVAATALRMIAAHDRLTIEATT